MKVFLSWSGETSHRVALAFKDWLPNVIQSAEPYLSSEDIHKGERWAPNIAAQLESTFFGIVCLTKDNVESPWVNFESGALSKTIETSKVVPFLFNLEGLDTKHPLGQFQYVRNTKDDMSKLVLSINESCNAKPGLEPERIVKAFEKWWPDLEESLASVARTTVESSETVARTSPVVAMLEEVLELSRTQLKLLKAPDQLLPPEYLATLVGSGGRLVVDPTEPIMRLKYVLEQLTDARLIAERAGEEKAAKAINNALETVLIVRRRLAQWGMLSRRGALPSPDPRLTAFAPGYDPILAHALAGEVTVTPNHLTVDEVAEGNLPKGTNLK